MKVRGEELNEQEVIQKGIVTFYEELYSKPGRWRPFLEMHNCPMLHDEDNILLQAHFEQQEILDSIKACAEDKATGPDSYIMAFFRHCWEIIKFDLIETVQCFHISGTFEKSINVTFVALIPKKVRAVELTDFRPWGVQDHCQDADRKDEESDT